MGERLMRIALLVVIVVLLYYAFDAIVHGTG